MFSPLITMSDRIPLDDDVQKKRKNVLFSVIKESLSACLSL